MAETHRPAFEPADIARPWIISGAVLGFLAVAALLMAILLTIYLAVAPKPVPPEVFPEPRLQPHPRADLAAYRKAQRAKLNHSGWVDKPAGIVAIPVDKAMAIIAGRGNSAFDPLPQVAPRKGGTP